MRGRSVSWRGKVGQFRLVGRIGQVGGEDWPCQGCGWEEEGLVGGGSFLRQCLQLCQEKGWIYICISEYNMVYTLYVGVRGWVFPSGWVSLYMCVVYESPCKGWSMNIPVKGGVSL